MADSSGSAKPGGGYGVWAAVLSEWEHTIAEVRDRTAELTARSQSAAAQEPRLVALQELSLTQEELAVAEEELRTQNEELTLAYVLIDAERHRYRELFFAAPVPYLVTDKHGTVVEGNQALAALLGKRVDWLCGKPLIVLRRTFRGVGFETSSCG